MSTRDEIRAKVDTATVLKAYRALGKRQMTSLTKKSLRAAMAPVREQIRSAWLSEAFREGGKYKRKKKGRRGMKRTAKRAVKTRGLIGPAPLRARRSVVVRKAIAKAVTLKADKYSNGRFFASVGIDYSKRGLKSQQRVAHIIERGARSKMSKRFGFLGKLAAKFFGIGRRLRPRLVSTRVNQRMQPIVQKDFVDRMEGGIANAFR